MLRKHDEIIANLKELLTEDISITLAKLKELLPAKSKKANSLLILQARYNEHNKKLLRGIISESHIGLNQIRNEILNFINSLESLDFNSSLKEDLDELKGYEGHLLYKIPPEMELGKKETCVIRIAIEKEVLLRDLKKTIGINQEGLEKVSSIMQVVLFDPSTETPFEIQAINESEQLILNIGYTEWHFWVTPLKTGKFPLILKIAVIEEVYGKERKREITFEKEIKVSVEKKENVNLTFEESGVKLNFTSQESKLEIGSTNTKGLSLLKKLIASFFTLLFLLIGFLIGDRLANSKTDSRMIILKEQIDSLNNEFNNYINSKSKDSIYNFIPLEIYAIENSNIDVREFWLDSEISIDSLKEADQYYITLRVPNFKESIAKENNILDKDTSLYYIQLDFFEELFKAGSIPTSGHVSDIEVEYLKEGIKLKSGFEVKGGEFVEKIDSCK